MLLNFLSSGRPSVLLRSVSPRVLIPVAVLKEVIKEPIPVIDSDGGLDVLISSGVVIPSEPSDEEIDLAVGLAGAEAPDDLDDGEAFAIALAIRHGGTIGVDDRKARRVIGRRWPELHQQYSIELFKRSARQANLADQEYADLLFSALKVGRMRVPFGFREEIVGIIGPGRARLCPSLGVIL